MMFAGASLALCAAMPAAAEISEDDILFIRQFCIGKMSDGQMLSDYNDSNGYIECLIAGIQVATGNTIIGLDIYPVELWRGSSVNESKAHILIIATICNNRDSLGIEEIGALAALECLRFKEIAMESLQ